MKFVLWLTFGIVLGPSLWSLPMPAWYGSLAQIAGALFLFIAGWELKFLDLKKDSRFYLLNFIGAFAVPFVIGYLSLGHNLFMAAAMSISALPVAIQILKEQNLLQTSFGRRSVTLASLCDVMAWIILIFILPTGSRAGWLLSHWLVMCFFIGLLAGRFIELPEGKTLGRFQNFILAPLFFVGLGWQADVVNSFSLSLFLSLVISLLSPLSQRVLASTSFLA